MNDLEGRIKQLNCWRGGISLSPLSGGITNTNYSVQDDTGRYVVRVGDDIPLHQIMRFNELSASKAAFRAGISPEVYHAEPGFLVLRFIEGKTLTEKDIQTDSILQRILPVLKTCHQDIPQYLKGPALAFWVFHVLNDYADTIQKGDGRLGSLVPDLMSRSSVLEAAIGQIDLIYGHNDLLAANFLDDGQKIWLVDWDYAGFNSPLFDLGGLASNNGLSMAQEGWLLETYFEKPLSDQLWHRYTAMKCASLLRETLWSMVSEIHSTLDFDYPTYTDDNLTKFQSAYSNFKTL
ncbi:MAG: phosphotransferase [Sneathiella sp.]